MTAAASHRLLVLEPDEARAAVLVGIAEAMGARPARFTTLEELLAAASAAPACAVLLGPSDVRDDTVRALRAIDARRNGDDHHVLPIFFAAAGTTLAPELVSWMHHLGADAFLPDDRALAAARAKLQLALAGRERHRRCDALRPSSPDDPAPPPELRLVFTTERKEKRTVVLVSGRRVLLPDRELLVLIILAAKRLAGAPMASLSELGIRQSPTCSRASAARFTASSPKVRRSCRPRPWGGTSSGGTSRRRRSRGGR